MCNRRVVRGYGTVQLPTTPGRHEREVRLFRPISSSLWTQFMGWLTGNPAQFIDPRITTQVEGRDVIRAEVHFFLIYSTKRMMIQYLSFFFCLLVRGFYQSRIHHWDAKDEKI